MGEVWYTGGGDVRLFAWMEGDGPAIVFLHGGPGTHREALPFVHPLSDRFKVICPDIRGRGQSVCRDPDLHKPEQYADDVVALLDHLGIERAAVGGRSLGAGTAILTGLRHPDRVAALVLASNGARGDDYPGLESQNQGLKRFTAFFKMVEAQGMGAAIEGFAAALPPALGAHARRLWGQHDSASIVAGFSALDRDGVIHQGFVSDDLRRLTMPTLVVSGQDDVHPREVSDFYMTLLPNATLSPAAVPLPRQDFLVGSDGRPVIDEDYAILDDMARDVVGEIRKFLEQHLLGVIG